MQLLLVEDDDIVTQVVIEGLSAAGFTVDCVRNLENASTALAAAHFDAVMLDLGLPDGDGGQWLKIRRAAGETVPVLIVTAQASTDDTVNGLNLGAEVPQIIAAFRSRRSPIPTIRQHQRWAHMLVLESDKLRVKLRERRQRHPAIRVERHARRGRRQGLERCDLHDDLFIIEFGHLLDRGAHELAVSHGY